MNQKIFIIGLLALINIQLTSAQELSIKKMPFSKAGVSEIAPSVKDTVLYFSSNKNIKWVSKPTDQNRENFYNLFYTTQNTDSSWTRVKRYLPTYFSDFHTSSIAFAPDKHEVYFTELQFKTKKAIRQNTGENLHGIYYAKELGDELSPAQNVNVNSTDNYNTGHPAISPDGRFLFFVSDKEGGYGKTDLYVSEKVKGKWGPATNLGATINTEGSEVFPFYHKSGKLYFSSEGHDSAGGLDIFYTRKTEKGWAKPIPLDNSINTEANEFSCYIKDSMQGGYFASDRNGDDDIFEFEYLYPIFGDGKKQKENTFRYKFYDRMGGKGDGPLKYVWYFGDGGKAEGDTIIYQYKKPGNYHIRSFLYDSIQNVELFILNDFYQEVKRKIQVYISCPDVVKINEPQTLSAAKSNLGDFKPNGYYWELPDGTKQKGETIQHIFRTKGKYRIKCGTISQDDPHQKMCTYKEITVIE